MAARARRVCMVVDNHYPDIRVEREANALLERGYRVDVICLRAPGAPSVERSGQLTIFRLPVSRRRGASAVVQLWEYLSFLAWATAKVTLRHLRVRYDVVHVHNLPDFLVFSSALAKALGASVILDLHDLMPEFFASRFGGDLRRPLARGVLLQERVATAFADRVLTVTDLWRDALVDRGVPSDKVHVVMNLPDENLFALREPTIRSPEAGLLVVYHGTITHRYGVDVLLQGFALARKRVPLRLLIHGRGEYLDEARRWAAELQIADDVRFSTELLSTTDLVELIGTGDIGVVPNRSDLLTDGILPTKLMEYAALGIPSVVSRSSAVATYFSDDMVRFVEPGDPTQLADGLVELAQSPERRLSLARNAQTFSREHRWADQAASYAALVDGLIRRDQQPQEPHGGLLT